MANGETPNPVLGVQVPPPLLISARTHMSFLTRIPAFLQEVKVELGKVSWSTKPELIGSTTVVIVLTSLIAVFIFLIDVMLARLLSLLLKI
jgi:preprotein translocase subunit SecE